MLLAKLEPGTINAPYVTDMNVVPLPSMTFSVNGSETTTLDISAASIPVALGSTTYTLFMYCPVLSMTSGIWGGSKISGFTLKAFSNANTVFTPMIQLGQGYTLSDFLSANPTDFATDAFVWASKLSFSVSIPEANIAGIIHKGTLQFNQIENNKTFTLRNLISIASSTQKLKTDDINFSLKTAVVQHALISTAPETLTGPTGEPLSTDPLNLEMINYVILESAGRNITTGALTPFSVAWNNRANMAFFPKATNSLMNNLFRGSTFSGNMIDKHNHLSEHLRNIAHHPEAHANQNLIKGVG